MDSEVKADVILFNSANKDKDAELGPILSKIVTVPFHLADNNYFGKI